jgi:hypothetical protein
LPALKCGPFQKSTENKLAKEMSSTRNLFTSELPQTY